MLWHLLSIVEIYNAHHSWLVCNLQWVTLDCLDHPNEYFNLFAPTVYLDMQAPITIDRLDFISNALIRIERWPEMF